MTEPKNGSIKWEKGALYDLRSSRRVVSHLERIRDRVLSDAESSAVDKDSHYEGGSKQGAKKPQGRWRASVVTANAEAMAEEGRNNTLLKALHAQGRKGESNRGG